MRVTLRDIAQKVNLSHATVSFVLNERLDISIPDVTRQRVMRAAHEMGYRPNRVAQALVRGRSNLVTLWMPSLEAHLQDGFVHALHHEVASQGYELFLRSGEEQMKVDLDDWPCDGAFILEPDLCPSLNLSQVGELPVVTVGGNLSPFDSLVIDWAAGAREALALLKDAGCQRIAYLSAVFPGSSEDQAKVAYLETMAAMGQGPEVIAPLDSTAAGVRSWVKAHVRTHGLPEGLLAGSDDAALAAIRGLADLGFSAPTHCRVIGCGGSTLGEFLCPSLSTVAVSSSGLAAAAWALMKGQIDARQGGLRRDRQQVVLKPFVIERESSRGR